MAKPASFTVSCTTLTTADDFRPPAAKYDRDHERAERAPGDLRDADHDGQDPRDADQLAGEDADRADPQERGDGRAHAPVVAPLEEVADRAQVVLGGERGGCAVRRSARAPAIRAPRTRPTTSPRGRRDSRARSRRSSIRADVRGEERREQQSRAERASGDEEVARPLQPPRDPHAQRNLRDRVRRR